MKTDLQIKSDVIAELAWDAAVNEAGIGVSVKDGVVTLTGRLETFAEKHAVEKAVRRVAGVRGIAVELEVSLPVGHVRTDPEVAKAAVDALRWHTWVPEQRIKVLVEDGWVTLTGEVDSRFQLTSADQCIRSLTGVRGVTNKITVKPRASEKDIAAEISAALVRHAHREANHIQVDVDGSVVTLTGDVDSLADHEAALGAAWSTRGVGRVVDKLAVRP